MAGKRIYFAGSIRGGRTDAALYKRIITYIQRTDMVLTEHIGDLSLSQKEGSTPKGFKDECLQKEHIKVERKAVDIAIYEEDTAWLRSADLVIAECTTPSLGVGYELAYAEGLGKLVHIFYNRNRTTLSAMLAGNRYFDIHPYSSEDEIYPIIDAILRQ